ncbi:hypothetical protein L2E82_39979 [Cichorium intybus]|uniref:Uncharacterized protein n=1 Tax=Cichorium intybus TaxID=13427 RepID=A0ACB9AKP2_CICIN|nr:hypothetical protein L2E82_39979 [Cichorium intybus]
MDYLVTRMAVVAERFSGMVAVERFPVLVMTGKFPVVVEMVSSEGFDFADTSLLDTDDLPHSLKQRVILTLNKIADRDTYEIGVEELGRTIETLTPDGISPFLSCILDTDSEKKNSRSKRMHKTNRTTKMLKNPHFMAKPAMIELNRSIIHAGGASTQSTLNAAMSSIQEGLKNSDWRTRKAACEALAEIASNNGSYSSSIKSYCIRALE